MTELNEQAIIGLSVTTSFLRNDWDNQTSVSDVDAANGFDDIIEMAQNYCAWVGIEKPDLTREDVIGCVWGDIEIDD
ncbi:hypothetical protein RAZWK3B_09901 [Roseobacter sp. AzwK-3b]|uniref:hypothetical protein n=1 Tax=Roseobacter sp. AzwK-3b TaxID=351016 RepID=UPI0001568F9E|nr:hypothetical protein [Roseobacter sp. AzwK-3b]EDM72556.1 hypothetical protein RAZWK3B_09901 [Roseobacter sp. AzwK-3b]